MAHLPLAPYDEGDALQALLCDGSDCDDDLSLFSASWGADAPPVDTHAGADFRCLEPEHSASCMRCTPPPPVADAARYELVGDPGKKNGEKRLRATLTRTPEWASLASRERAAAALRAQSPRLAAALLSRRSAAMTKAELMLLCAHWRLKSDRWRRRGDRPARPPAVPAPLPVVERPLFPPPLRLDAPESLHAAAVWAHIGAALRPMSLRCGPLLAGPGAAALAARDPAAARLYRRELAVIRSLEAEWAGRQSIIPNVQLNVYEAERQLPAAAASAPAASYSMPPAVQAVPVLVQMGTKHFMELREFGVQRLAEPGNGLAELTWLEEMLAVHGSSAELMSQVGVLLGASMRASAATHIAVASMLLDLMLAHIGTNFNAFSQRRRWLEALPAVSDDDCSFDMLRKPLMPPLRTPTLECLPIGCMGAVTA